MSQRSRMMAPHTALLVVGAAIIATLVVGGYGFKWAWTGVGANTHLWDWMQLLVFPLTIVTLPIWFTTQRRWGRRWLTLFGTLLVAFVIVVIGGYGLNWTWTGFQGNTLWDWWHLLLAPFALPIVVTWVRTHPERVAAALHRQNGAGTDELQPEASPAQRLAVADQSPVREHSS